MCNIPLCIYTTFLLSSPRLRNMNFHFLAIVNDSAMNMAEHECRVGCQIVGHMTRSGIAGSSCTVNIVLIYKIEEKSKQRTQLLQI